MSAQAGRGDRAGRAPTLSCTHVPGVTEMDEPVAIAWARAAKRALKPALPVSMI